MLRKLVAPLCAMAFWLGFAAQSEAILITSNGDFTLVSDQDGVSPISDIEILTGGGATGRTYTNQTSAGVPFGLGADIRTISAYAVGSATDGISHTGVKFADGDLLIIVTALLGKVTTVGMGGIVTATFSAGRSFAVKIAPGAYDARNPDSFDSGTIVAEFALLPQQAVLSGSPLGFNTTFAETSTNQSSVNSTSPQQTQGVFLFVEDSKAGQTPGDGLLSNVDVPPLPPGQAAIAEALIADIDQTLQLTDLEDWDDPTGALGAGDLTALNFYAGLAGFADLGGAGTGFATGFGGAAASEFNPQFPPPAGDGPTGDFFATLGVDNYVAVLVVPEPGSMALLAIGAACCGLGFRRRQKNTATAA